MSDTAVDILDTVAAVQEGDYETLKTVLSNRIVSANSKDESGCTLLHWAAINNRITIAKLLIEYGANSMGGGLLNESPLQWALRKRFYAMAELLVEKLHVDLRHKSAQGLDALHLCCRLEDLQGIYLLLYWGANPDTVDNDGNTPLLWLVKSEYTAEKAAMMWLLVKFGASVLAQDNGSLEGIFHVFAKKKSVNLSIAFFLFQQGASNIPSLTNSSGRTPLAESIRAENRDIAGLLFDAPLFNYFSFWFPSVVVAVQILLTFLFFQLFGLVITFIFAGLASVAIYFFLLQPRVIDYYSRIHVGVYHGLLVALFLHFYQVLMPLTSVLTSGILLTLFLATISLGSLFSTTKPLTLRKESKSSLAKEIIQSSPSEGTDEENTSLSQCDNRRVRIMKDIFTGAVKILRDERHLSDVGDVRLRTPGPELCCTCLCDKRVCILGERRTRPRNDVESGNSGRGVSTDVVSSCAMHCNFCQSCVVESGHHVKFLGNCTGIGNRRIFFFYLVVSFFTSLLYFTCSKWVQYNVYCSFNESTMIERVYLSESCAFANLTTFLFLQILAVSAAVWFSVQMINEIDAIGNHMLKLANSSNRSNSSTNIHWKKLRYFVRFLKSGQYTHVVQLEDREDTGSQSEDYRSNSFQMGENDDFNYDPDMYSSDEAASDDGLLMRERR